MSDSELYWPMPKCLEGDPAVPDCSAMEVEEYLTYRFAVLSHELGRNISRYFTQQLGLSLAETRVLTRLQERGPLSYGGLCELLHVDGALISRSAASLVERGLITKTTDPKDARRAIFALTEEGREVALKILDIGRRRQKALLDRLTPGERRVALEVISKLMSYATELNATGRFLGVEDDESANRA